MIFGKVSKSSVDSKDDFLDKLFLPALERSELVSKSPSGSSRACLDITFDTKYPSLEGMVSQGVPTRYACKDRGFRNISRIYVVKNSQIKGLYKVHGMGLI